MATCARRLQRLAGIDLGSQIIETFTEVFQFLLLESSISPGGDQVDHLPFLVFVKGFEKLVLHYAIIPVTSPFVMQSRTQIEVPKHVVTRRGMADNVVPPG